MKDIDKYTNKLIAHRGFHDIKKGIPENSLEAFKRAIIFNYHIELDVAMLKDESIVVFHDRSLKRVCNVNKDISNLTYDEIKHLKLFNTNSKIPLLKEVLELDLSNTILFIDIKPNVKEKQLLKILEKYKVNYVIISFFPNNLIWFKKNKPNVKRGLLLTNLDLRGSLIRFIKFYKPDFLFCNINMFKRETIDKYRKNIPIIGWTITTKKDYFNYKKHYDNLICENMNIF